VGVSVVADLVILKYTHSLKKCVIINPSRYHFLNVFLSSSVLNPVKHCCVFLVYFFNLTSPLHTEIADIYIRDYVNDRTSQDVSSQVKKLDNESDRIPGFGPTFGYLVSEFVETYGLTLADLYY
jgi:hypothetical protein